MQIEDLFHLKKLPPPRRACANQVLAFVIQPQGSQTEWCWSACAVSVNRFYSPASTWTQCLLANSALGQTSCCQNPGSAQCNQPWYLDRALQIVGNFASYSNGKAVLPTVEGEINSNRPVGMRIGWNGGGGHFIIIYGYYDCGSGNTQDINVGDPFYGSSVQPYGNFPATYQGGGTWTGTYLTHP
jgi:hypothetical protein